MASKYDEIDLSRISTIPMSQRGSKSSIRDYGTPIRGDRPFREWLESLPGLLASERVRMLVDSIRAASGAEGKEIVWMIGAHVIKCGLPPYLISLMEKGFITVLAMNGACAIHDLEIAFFGETSEDVPANLQKGIFGFSAETASHLVTAVEQGRKRGWGLGESIGSYIMDAGAPYSSDSIFAEAFRLGVPATVHIAIGTDIINQHPGYDGAAWGELSARDFRIFSGRVEKLGNAGGVAINLGSAVILPEVFLKAFSIARNLGASFDRITTCNIDMIQHYRPGENVLARPSSFGGSSLSLTGHHELIIPILYSALVT